MLFYDDEFHPLRACIEGGKGYKESASHLWPGMKPESAYARLKACTTVAGDQKLKFGEIVALMKFNSRFDPLLYACDETSHNRPTQIAPKDAEARAVQLIEDAGAQMERAMRTLADLKRSRDAVPTIPRSVRP